METCKSTNRNISLQEKSVSMSSLLLLLIYKVITRGPLGKRTLWVTSLKVEYASILPSGFSSRSGQWTIGKHFY